MSYVKMGRPLGAIISRKGVNASSVQAGRSVQRMAQKPTRTASRCRPGERWDTIENICVAPTRPPGGSSGSVTQPTPPSRVPPPPPPAPRHRVPPPSPPAPRHHTPPPLPPAEKEPEHITEDGFSAPAPPPPRYPIPPSDGSSAAGPATVPRVEAGPVQELVTDMFDESSVKVVEPFYKNPLVLGGAAVLVAVLVLKK